MYKLFPLVILQTQIFYHKSQKADLKSAFHYRFIFLMTSYPEPLPLLEPLPEVPAEVFQECGLLEY